MESSEKKGLVVNFTVIVTFLPALVYICSFFYEKGICQNFHIPDHMIEPTLTNVLTFGGIFFIFIVIGTILQVLVSIPLAVLFASDNRYVMVSAFITCIGILVVYRLIWHHTLVLPESVNLFVQIGAYFFSTVVLTVYFKKLATWAISRLLMTDNIQKIFPDFRFNYSLFYWAIPVLALPWICFKIGDDLSYNQKQFSVLERKKSYIILRHYGDNLICRGVDVAGKSLNDTLSVIKINEGDQLAITEKRFENMQVMIDNLMR